MSCYKYLFIALLSLLSQAVCASPDNLSLRGTIKDKKTNEPLIGATIYIPDLKTGTITNVNGEYVLNNLPKGRHLMQVKYIGYSTQSETIELTESAEKNFLLEETATEVKEVVVTGVSQATERHRTPSPISVISSLELKQTASANIIDAVAKQPGIAQITTGPGISKPVIRGLGYNRVIVMNDGIRQEGQQWGDEHGIEIDENAVNSVEILKGPASLAYGSDAMAGVINFLSAPTLPPGTITGNVMTNYQSNNGLVNYSANIAGNRNSFIWDARFTQKFAHAYQNKADGYVFNSGFRESDFSAILGVNKGWGYSHLHLSGYNLKIGIVEGERDSATGAFMKQIATSDSTAGRTIASHKDLTGYTINTPFQRVSHYKAVLNNSFVMGDGRLNAIIGFQQNRRQEFANIMKPDEYGLYFLLNTLNYNFQYIRDFDNWQTAFGVNGMQQSSLNKGAEFLVPEYDLFDVGSFVSTHKSFNKLDLSGGIRYDLRTQKGKQLIENGEQRFPGFRNNFTGVSGSVGATYQFSERVTTKFNVSKGYRAPNIAELGSNGVHEGTLRYEIGNAELKPENSIQLDLGLVLNTTHVSAEVSLFRNMIDNFIFPVRLNSLSGGDSIRQGVPVYKFTSGYADLSGAEAIIDIHPHPLDWLHFENSFSFVTSTQRNATDSTKYLPFTPAAKIGSEIKATAKSLGSHLKNGFIRFGVDNYFPQNHVYSAYGTEKPTPGYSLLNLGIGTDYYSGGTQRFSLFINVSNLTDIAYQSHLSRLKYGPLNYTTGQYGVFNMGRNISVKLIVPISFSKAS